MNGVNDAARALSCGEQDIAATRCDVVVLLLSGSNGRCCIGAAAVAAGRITICGRDDVPP